MEETKNYSEDELNKINPDGTEQEDHFDDNEVEIEPEDPGYTDDEVLVEDEDNIPYSTKDLALGVIDLFNSDSQDYNTGTYDKTDEAFEKLSFLPIMDKMSDDDWYAMVEDLDYSILQKFMESNPDSAEKIFNTVAKVFGFSSYQDYKTYVDWINDGGEEEYLNDLGETTNPGAVANVPGKHILLDLDEEDEEKEDEC